MIVLDASAAIEFLLNSPLGERVGNHLTHTPGQVLHTPHLLDVEVLHVIRRLCSRGKITERRARQILTDLTDLPIIRHAHEPLVGRAWSLRATLTAYDAIYVALAEALEASIVTCDGRLGRAHGHQVQISVIA